MNKIIEAIEALKSSFKYSWKWFKNTITINMFVESEFLKINWTDTYEGLCWAKLMPSKRISEVFRDLINIIKAYMPDEVDEINEFVKELDKKVKIDLVSYDALKKLLENQYEVKYEAGLLTISITNGDMYFIVNINEEFIRSLREIIEDPDMLKECVPAPIREWIEAEEEKKNSKKNKLKNKAMELYQTYAEFVDKDSEVNFSDKYWEVVFKNPGDGYPDDIELNFDSDLYDIDRAKRYLKQWKEELPKIKKQKEREALIKQIGDKYPEAITYEGWDTYVVRVNNECYKIDVEKTPIEEIKSIIGKLDKVENN